jgi:hypothetical protein
MHLLDDYASLETGKIAIVQKIGFEKLPIPAIHKRNLKLHEFFFVHLNGMNGVKDNKD